MATVDPETLLKKSADVKLASGIVLSVIIHLALIALTSFGLYRAWMKWGIKSEKGFNTPGVIKQLEKEASKKAVADAEKAEADAKQKADAKAAAKEDEQADAAKARSTAADDAKAAMKEVDAEAAASAKSKADDAPQVTPLEKQVEAPPKNFDLQDVDL